MAHQRIIAGKRREAQVRLVESASRAAEALGLEPPAIPFHHKNAEVLPALQADAISDFLDELANRAQVARLKAAAVRELAVEAGVEEAAIADVEAAIDEIEVVVEEGEEAPAPIEGEEGEPAEGGDGSGAEGEPVEPAAPAPEDPSKCKDGESLEECGARQEKNRIRREKEAAKKAAKG